MPLKTPRSLGLATMLAGAAALAGCQQSAAPDAQDSAAATDTAAVAGPDAKPGITASEARLVLPVVPGRPGVAYFKVRNGNAAAVTLAGVHLEGVGKAEMHRTEGGKMTPVATLPIAAGETATFAPGGLHVMVFDVAKTLEAGGETELTLTFADGDKISLPVTIEAMGAAATQR